MEGRGQELPDRQRGAAAGSEAGTHRIFRFVFILATEDRGQCDAFQAGSGLHMYFLS